VAPEALIANADYLQKPYRSETLLAKIDALLASPDSRSDKTDDAKERAGRAA
jgi:DNA-binding response OmpR family regulator